jgi:hypothetical protein
MVSIERISNMFFAVNQLGILLCAVMVHHCVCYTDHSKRILDSSNAGVTIYG